MSRDDVPLICDDRAMKEEVFSTFLITFAKVQPKRSVKVSLHQVYTCWDFVEKNGPHEQARSGSSFYFPERFPTRLNMIWFCRVHKLQIPILRRISPIFCKSPHYLILSL